MSALSILLAVAIIWCAVSPLAAVVLGKAVRLADAHETPPPGVLGEAAPERRALRVVR